MVECPLVVDGIRRGGGGGVGIKTKNKDHKINNPIFLNY